MDNKLIISNGNFFYKNVKTYNLKKAESKNNQNSLVLKNLNLELESNKIYGIIGKNGAGKSTLMKLLFGILKLNSGTFIQNYNRVKLLDSPNFYHTELNSFDNFKAIYILENNDNFNSEDYQNKLNTFKYLTQLSESELIKPISNLSSGTKSKIGFALTFTFVEGIDMLGLDEFFNFGDKEFKEFSSNVIKEKINHVGTAVIVSHSMELIKNICDKTILIHNSEINSVDDTNEVVEKYLNL